MNRAAEEFAAVKGSYWAVSERGQPAYDMNAQLAERFCNRVVETAGEGRRSLKEELRSIIRESVRRSEAGIGEEPQEDGGTVAPDGGGATGEGPPLEDYDSLNVEQISNRLEGLSVEELEQLRRYEAANKNRSTLHRRIENMIASSNI